MKTALALVLILGVGGAVRAADATLFHVGVAKVDITPDYPVRLNGYLARKGESEGVIQRIHAKALAIGRGNDAPAVLVSVDNCIIPEAIRTTLAARLAKAGVRDERFSLCASHTHSAPKLGGAADNIFGADIPPDQQTRIDRYTREFVDKLEQVALAALRDRQPAKLRWGRAQAEFAANRRTKGGPVDHALPVLVVTAVDGDVRALVTNYACHCTTLGPEPNQICGDWAGYAQEYIEAAHPGVIALTLIGCGADANPAPRPGVDLAKQHGRTIADAVESLFGRELTTITAKLETRVERISIPFDALPSRVEWEARAAKDDPTGYHARKNLARLDRGEALPTELPYLIQVWSFGPQLALVFLPGEVVVDYALRLKTEFDPSRLWVTAYANGVPCYIPSRRVWKEGGYEGGKAMIYYDLPTRLAEDTEDRIVGAVQRLMPRDYRTSPPAK
ncbi:MAG: neutral/alkaline non-lysosomal ceramidase N-terminal domain-containing protein [Opitutaceae bacterium]|nr:neutral/alkaline non-lysosomal ceramidase N-terminal domain-containing protein [Opitutaceae bacterium]